MSVRSRVKYVDPISYYQNAKCTYHGTYKYAPPGRVVTCSGYNSLDEFFYDSDRKDHGVKPCQHYKKVMTVFSDALFGDDTWCPTTSHLGIIKWSPALPLSPAWDGVYTSWLGDPSASFGAWAHPVKGLPPLVVEPPYTARSVPDVEGLDDLVLRALKAMLPGIRPELSLVNSVIELKDFKSLPRTIAKARKVLSFVQAWSQRSRKGLGASWWRDKTIRSIVNTVGDVYLQQQFNIKPLVSDIQGVYNTLVGVRRELEELKARAGKRQKRRFRCFLTDKYFDHYDCRDMTTRTEYVPRVYHYAREVKYLARMFNATIEYSYELPQWTDEELLVRALLDKLGVNSNPAIIWNALKWSFVVDWVAGVGQMLDRFKVRNIEPKTVIHSFCYSTRVERLLTLSAGFGSMNAAASINESAYRRYTNMPSQSSIKLSGLNPKEFILGSALVVTSKVRP